MRYALLVSYDGTHFSGYQRQRKERTVQGELERAAAEIAGCPVKVYASGRTDAGVHARGQVCMFDAETHIPAEKLRECFNRLLPPDVKVLSSVRAPDGFDCTRQAKRKTYRYRAYFAETEMPLLRRYAARVGERADVNAMREAAALLLGEHDFKAFSSTGSSAKTSVRTVYAIDVAERAEGDAVLYEIAVTGNGFLYHMVRILAGELFAVGCGKPTSALLSALRTGERSLVAKTMPPEGLTLERVEYASPLFSE